MSDITELYRELGLNDEEYRRIVEVLGREPTYTELGMYSVMWSEHCGYKYSRPVLRLFKTYREAQDAKAMENAGVVPIGDGLGVVFKMESHNHPSAVEPFQGAATGVGGILRDIFTMGARPIACLDSLRFGELDDPRVRYLLDGVVSGIAFYGNCVGVPTVGGEVYFNNCYKGNPLVNVMCVGLVEMHRIARAKASGVGNPVMLVGSRTGRDGMHGCSILASSELSEESLANRPTVQAGDPFTEKLLIEATLEALQTGYIVGIQDMGAAGITCSACETAAKGGTGMRIDVLKVPRREEGMTPYEVMLSESQERMLCIVQRGHEDDVAAVFRKWGLNAAVIGEVTDDRMLTVCEGDKVVAQVPAVSLADECPTYYLDTAEPDYIAEVQSWDLSSLPQPDDPAEVLLKLLASPTIASKEWIYSQYDHMVQTNTVVLPGSDAAVLRIKGTRKAVALTADCNSRYCYLDPYVGAQIAVAEAARNLSCSGAKPLGVTDCLNFASPQRPEIFWQFRRSVEGMAAACEYFGLPVVSGNVSFYNETPEQSIFPTPVVGMVGFIEDVTRHCTAAFKEHGHHVVLLGPGPSAGDTDGIGGSEYLKVVHNLEVGKPPKLDLDLEARLHKLLRSSIAKGLLASAHDCSEGGAVVALAEACILGRKGAIIEWPGAAVSLFAEVQSRAVVTVSEENLSTLLAEAEALGVPARPIGRTGGTSLSVHFGIDQIQEFSLDVLQMEKAWRGAIPCMMKA
ncbi:MAG: phosphoribosylformylglycinamidine synthase subunit PurL [Armatimonadota bacterium]